MGSLVLRLGEESGEVRTVSDAADCVQLGQVVLQSQAALGDDFRAEVPGQVFARENHLLQLLIELLQQFVVEAGKVAVTALDRHAAGIEAAGTHHDDLVHLETEEPELRARSSHVTNKNQGAGFQVKLTWINK